jgi:hypothetical protein
MIYIDNINDFINKKEEYAEICYEDTIARFVPNRAANIHNPWRPRSCIDPITNAKKLDDYSAWKLIGDHLYTSSKSDWLIKEPTNKNIHTKQHAFESKLLNKNDNRKDVYIKILVTKSMKFVYQDNEFMCPRVLGISFHTVKYS